MSEGLITHIWGPPTWEALHCITFNYPHSPTPQDRQHYKTFFEMLKYVLPCSKCREHYAKNIKEGKTKLTDEVFTDRDTLTKWLYTLHNKVSASNHKTYHIDFEDVKQKYNSYIVKCSDPQRPNPVPYKHAYNKEAPVIDYNLVVKLEEYAEARGVDDFLLNVMETKKLFESKDGDKNMFWRWRNEKCQEIIKHMRIEGIPSLEPEGYFKGLPTISELELMLLLCSNLNSVQLEEVVNKVVKKMSSYVFDDETSSGESSSDETSSDES